MVATACAAQQVPNSGIPGLSFTVVEPMTPRQVAETKARVAGELAKSGAGPWFEDATDQTSSRARHKPSGLLCPLGKKGQRIVSASADFATCETRNGDSRYVTTVTRAPAGTTLASLAAEARGAAQREPGFSPYQGPAIVGHPGSEAGLPDHETIRFLSRLEGRERLVRVQIGIVRGWILTERRVSGKDSQNPIGMMEILAEATFGHKMKP
jgi:hypothetical protein